MWYKKIIKAVNRGIDNLAELEKLEKKKRRTENVYFKGFIKTLINFAVISEFN